MSGSTHDHGHTLDTLFFLHSLSMFDFVSDHKCLDTTLQPNDQMQKRTVHSSLLTAHSTATFSSCYSDIFLPPPDPSNINSLVSCFHSQCISALDTIATYSTRSISSTNFCPWINEDICKLRRKVRTV